MTVGLTHSDIIRYFDRWSALSEQRGELSTLQRAQIEEAVRRADSEGTITLRALDDAFEQSGASRDLIPAFALELLRLRGGRSIIGDAKTFAEAARRLEKYCGSVGEPDCVDADGNERHLSPHLETLFRERVLGLQWNDVACVSRSHGSHTGHHIFSDDAPLAKVELRPNSLVNVLAFDRVFCIERDGRAWFVRDHDRSLNKFSAARLTIEELEARQVNGFIAWRGPARPQDGMEGATNPSDQSGPSDVDLEIFVTTKDGPQSIGVLSRDVMGGYFRDDLGWSLRLHGREQFRDAELYERIVGADTARFDALSVETLDALDAAITELRASQSGIFALRLDTMRAQIAEARGQRRERDADHAARIEKATEELKKFSLGPGMILRVAMHELHELVRRLPGFRDDQSPDE